MKLIKCYISSFGKIKDFTLDFNDNINQINKPNGWGKSTLAGFIKCMFYGIRNDRKKSVGENERLLYKPWNSTEKFGGYIIFEKLGKEYKIERYFGLKESEDTVKFTELSTGREFNPLDLGKRAFEIDEEGYLSTTFFSQKDFEIKSNSSLTTKFNELYEISSEESYDDAILLLENKKKEYIKTGNKGLINETKNKIFELSDKIKNAEKCSENISNLKLEKENLEKDLVRLKTKKEELSNRLTEESKNQRAKVNKENYDLLIKERDELMRELSLPQKTINGNHKNANRIEEISSYLAKYNYALELREKIKSDINEIEKQKVGKGKSAKLTFIPSLILLLISVIFIFIWFPGCIIFGLLALVCFFVINRYFNKSKTKDSDLLNNKRQELINFDNQIREIEEYFNNYFLLFNLDQNLSIEEKCRIIKEAISSINNLTLKIDELQKKIDLLALDKSIFNISNENISIDVLSRELKDISNEFDEKNKKYNSIIGNMRYYENEAEELFNLENQRQELAENLIEYQRDFDIISKTISYFEKANDNLKTKYKAPLEESFNKYLSLIDDVGIKAKIDIDLNVKIIENSGETDTDYYSKGYKDLIGICKRFALTDVLYKKDKPFIVLDDPFYNLDKAKISNALSLIKKLSNEYQIIYLICHESRSLS